MCARRTAKAGFPLPLAKINYFNRPGFYCEINWKPRSQAIIFFLRLRSIIKNSIQSESRKNYQSSVVMISGSPPTPPEADLTRWFNFVALRPSTRRNNDSHSGWRVNVNHNYFLEAINHFHWPFLLFLRFAAGALARHRSRWKKTEKEVFGQWKKEKIESKNEMIIISLWTFYNQLIFICALRKWKLKQNRELWHSKNLWRALPPESGLAELHIIDTFIT